MHACMYVYQCMYVYMYVCMNVGRQIGCVCGYVFVRECTVKAMNQWNELL